MLNYTQNCYVIIRFYVVFLVTNFLHLSIGGAAKNIYSNTGNTKSRNFIQVSFLIWLLPPTNLNKKNTFYINGFIDQWLQVDIVRGSLLQLYIK